VAQALETTLGWTPCSSIKRRVGVAEIVESHGGSPDASGTAATSRTTCRVSGDPSPRSITRSRFLPRRGSLIGGALGGAGALEEGPEGPRGAPRLARPARLRLENRSPRPVVCRVRGPGQLEVRTEVGPAEPRTRPAHPGPRSPPSRASRPPTLGALRRSGARAPDRPPPLGADGPRGLRALTGFYHDPQRTPAPGPGSSTRCRFSTVRRQVALGERSEP